MNKLSITLPTGSQVCIESDDRDLVREVFYTFMPQLAGANGDASPATVGVNTVGSSTEPAAAHHNGNAPDADAGAGADHYPAAAPVIFDTPAATMPAPVAAAAPQPAPPYPVPATAASPSPAPAAAPVPPGEPAPLPLPLPATEPATAAEQQFRAFCQQVNPLGDMRRVVVAAEAAHRHLNVTSVDPDKLAELFTLAGWPIPHSFVQTLRNAARTKFRWLERIPGLPGHYKVTGTGRSIVLGDGNAASEAG